MQYDMLKQKWSSSPIEIKENYIQDAASGNLWEKLSHVN